MRPSLTSRRFHVVAVFVLLAVSGCLGGFGGPAISDDTARERALAAEEQFLRERLKNASCVNGWGTSSHTGVQAEATVVNRTEEGIHVDVVHPFWYGTDDAEADSRSEATYRVTENSTRRLGGDDVTPCR